MNEGLMARVLRRPGLPVVLQSEASECGLACLAMIAQFHGNHIGLGELRRLYPLSVKGTTLRDLMSVAHQLQLTTRAIRLDLEGLQAVRRPAILHWNLDHFVVLKGVSASRVEIHDPAVGHRVLRKEAVSRSFTGVALELIPAAGFTTERRSEQLRLSAFWAQAAGLTPFLMQLLLISAAIQVFALAGPFYAQLVVDEAIVRADRDLLTMLAAGFTTILVLRVLFGWLRSWVVIHLGNLFSLQIQSNLLRHLLRLPLRFFQARHIGDLVSRFGSTTPIQDLLTTGLVEAVLDGFLAIATLIVLCLYSPTLSAIVMGLLATYLVVRVSTIRYIQSLSHEHLIAAARGNTQFLETLRGMATIKQFGLELERLGQWQNRFVDTTNAGIAVARVNLLVGAANQLLFGVGAIIVVYVAGGQIIEQALTIGMLMAFLAYMQQFLEASGALVDRWMALKLLDLHLDRLEDIALSAPEQGDVPAPVAIDDAPCLVVESVTFSYASNDTPLLRNVALSVRSGERILILGSSGSGKSTLMRIMQGLEQPTAGTVKYAGADIANLGLANYRSLVASVTQEDRLLSGSLLENITLFDEKPDLARMVECARSCRIHDTIMAMPMNYHGRVGDMGDALSAGERQRVMLARALYRKPKILFLDEATCHLDDLLDDQINEMITNLNTMCISVSHRSTAARYADRVFVLKGGTLQDVHEVSRAALQGPVGGESAVAT